MFGMYLTPEVIGNAELTLGGVDESKIHGDVLCVISGIGIDNDPRSKVKSNGLSWRPIRMESGN